MVVVVIIAVLAVIAVPLFSARLQARRLHQVANEIADIYRGSRTRALARGAAVVVSLNQASSGNSSFQVLEGVEGTDVATASGKATCANLPTRGCLTNNWGNLGGGATVGTARAVEALGNEKVATNYAIGTSTYSSEPLYLCFSPAGRTYFNTTGTWTPESWQPLTSAVVVDVKNADSANATTRDYKVVIMPNGTSRLAL
jgi:type II secretory pathway pseudopilin PulG